MAPKHLGDHEPLRPSELEAQHPGKTEVLRSLWKQENGTDPLEDEKLFTTYQSNYRTKIKSSDDRALACAYLAVSASLLGLVVSEITSLEWVLYLGLSAAMLLLFAAGAFHLKGRYYKDKYGTWKEPNEAHERMLEFMSLVRELEHFLGLSTKQLMSLSEDELRERCEDVLLTYIMAATRLARTGPGAEDARDFYERIALEYGYSDRRHKTFQRFGLVELKGHYDLLAAKRLSQRE